MYIIIFQSINGATVGVCLGKPGIQRDGTVEIGHGLVDIAPVEIKSSPAVEPVKVIGVDAKHLIIIGQRLFGLTLFPVIFSPVVIGYRYIPVFGEYVGPQGFRVFPGVHPVPAHARQYYHHHRSRHPDKNGPLFPVLQQPLESPCVDEKETEVGNVSEPVGDKPLSCRHDLQQEHDIEQEEEGSESHNLRSFQAIQHHCQDGSQDERREIEEPGDVSRFRERINSRHLIGHDGLNDINHQRIRTDQQLLHQGIMTLIE